MGLEAILGDWGVVRRRNGQHNSVVTGTSLSPVEKAAKVRILKNASKVSNDPCDVSASFLDHIKAGNVNYVVGDYHIDLGNAYWDTNNSEVNFDRIVLTHRPTQKQLIFLGNPSPRTRVNTWGKYSVGMFYRLTEQVEQTLLAYESI
jgi:hypothetical protein